MRRVRATAVVAVPLAALLILPGSPSFAAFAAKWKIQATPNPAGATDSRLHAISCHTPHSCTAVGASNWNAGSDRTLAERWDGVQWAIQSTPNPGGTLGAVLSGIECPKGTWCMAVGRDDRSPGVGATLAERWNGTNWAIVPTPNAPGQAASALNAITCTWTNFCLAVGQAGPSDDAPVSALIEVWNGSTWTIQTAPDPGGDTAALRGASCSSPTECTAVGYWTYGTRELPLVERWDGSAWRIQSPQDPSGGQGAELDGVDCVSNLECMAVGSYVNGATLSLIERWDGNGWTITRTTDPQGATATLLSAVSCPSPLGCTTTGSYQTPTGQFPVSYGWDGVMWALSIPVAPPGSVFSSLEGVSCPKSSTPNVCESSGLYQDPSGNVLTLAEATS